MEADEPHDFNQRLGQWVSSQGFWFQLRHSVNSGGGWSITFFHLFRLLGRVAIVLFVAVVGLGIYLVKRVDSPKFLQEVQTELGEALNAESAVVSGFRKIQGDAMVRRIGLEGSEESFFQSLEAGNLQFKMGFLDGVVRGWDAGMIKVNWLDAELRAGSNSPEAVAASAASLFEPSAGFALNGIDVIQTRLSWGYFERAYGGISGSRMTATRTGEGWRVRFTGGHFSQNWIRRFEIETLVAVVSRDGIVIEEGLLHSGDGTVRFEDVAIGGGGVQPKPRGRLVFNEIPIQSVLPPNVRETISGTFSGVFELGGSLNSAEGLTFSGTANLDGPETITVRSELPLFEALDVVDVFNSYKRVDFDQGSFEINTGGGRLTVSQIDLLARDFMTVQGRFTVSRPSDEELEALFTEAEVPMLGGLAAEENAPDVSLKAAGKAANADQEEDLAINPEAQNALSQIDEARRLRREAMSRARELFSFDGGVRIMIPGDAFESDRDLRERFPLDQASGRIGIDAALQGDLGELTLELAEEILSLGQSDR